MNSEPYTKNSDATKTRCRWTPNSPLTVVKRLPNTPRQHGTVDFLPRRSNCLPCRRCQRQVCTVRAVRVCACVRVHTYACVSCSNCLLCRRCQRQVCTVKAVCMSLFVCVCVCVYIFVCGVLKLPAVPLLPASSWHGKSCV